MVMWLVERIKNNTMDNNIYFKFNKVRDHNKSFNVILNTDLQQKYQYKYNGYPKETNLIYAMIDGVIKVIGISNGQVKRLLNLFPKGKLPLEKYIILNWYVEEKFVADDRSFIDITYSLIDVTDSLVIFDEKMKSLIENNTLKKVVEYLVEEDKFNIKIYSFNIDDIA